MSAGTTERITSGGNRYAANTDGSCGGVHKARLHFDIAAEPRSRTRVLVGPRLVATDFVDLPLDQRPRANALSS